MSFPPSPSPSQKQSYLLLLPLKMLLFTEVIILLGLLPSSSLSSPEISAKKDTLKLVQVLFRHGDRAPTYTYPNDPYSDIAKYWPEGLAQLTNRGKMQQYELGQYLRRRYDGYLDLKYTPKELYVTSSDMDRTIMSLESNLAGLFPPVDPFNPEINWQPIPLRTIPWKEDKFLHNNVRCPRYRELRREFFASSDVVKKANEDNADFIRYCAEKSGLPASTVKELYPLFDVLYAQASHNFTLPEWAQGHVLPKLTELMAQRNTWPTYTEEMKRLTGGNLLHLLIKNMQAISSDDLGFFPENVHSVTRSGHNRKMLMYSGHDSTLVRIMNTMGVFEPHCPPYASALVIELHEDDGEMGEYFVEIHYRNDTTRAPYLLTPAKCGNPCKLSTFIEMNQHLIPGNWKRECQLHLEEESNKPFNLFALKMHEHDDHDDDEDDHEEAQPESLLTSTATVGAGAADGNPTTYSCYPSPLQLTLMGIGLFSMTSIAALLVFRFVQSQGSRRRDLGLFGDRGTVFVEVLQNKPSFYGGVSGYEKL